ncbi:hypothetical protein [Haloarchaeobius sp. HME9146]|uniref:hypothetical protein n=1 Tax=Haloarchaeobius sp. HME9146 TaxID=2978732 RepID=UPI0021BE240F|nr:hypothetical protein [Haloarchaeobius sp. HME9146]MCT9096589.1 hypothetical protein [Haloarchaeobius sp. HME9146]
MGQRDADRPVSLVLTPGADADGTVAETPTGSNLTAFACGEPKIAVGAGGTVIEGN